MNTTTIKNTVLSAIKQFSDTDTLNKIVTDFHIKVNESDGTFSITDDEDKTLASSVIDEFVDETQQNVEEILKNALAEMNAEEAFNETEVFKPFSFLLEDNEGETISELLIVDDETIFITDEELLKGLDEELDEFLKKLLAE